jgi:hypothetical protein
MLYYTIAYTNDFTTKHLVCGATMYFALRVAQNYTPQLSSGLQGGFDEAVSSFFNQRADAESQKGTLIYESVITIVNKTPFLLQ